MSTVGEALQSLESRLFVGRQQELSLFRSWFRIGRTFPSYWR